MDKFESQIVEYVADLEYKDLTRDAIEAAKERLLDSLAVAYASYPTKPVNGYEKFCYGPFLPLWSHAVGN